jgi:hypothetical protein
MAAKHTPGPWHWWKAEIDGKPVDDDRHVTTLDGPNGNSIVYHDAQWRVSDANARLIAAAPDLLEALRDLLRDNGLNARDAALAAIAKATGAALLLLLLLPSLASAQEVRTLYPAFVTARVLDLTSTHQALQAGATEINPLMKHPALRYALHPLMTVGFVAAAEQARATGKGKRAFWLMLAGTAGQFALDWNNYRQAANLRRGK